MTFHSVPLLSGTIFVLISVTVILSVDYACYSRFLQELYCKRNVWLNFSGMLKFIRSSGLGLNPSLSVKQ